MMMTGRGNGIKLIGVTGTMGSGKSCVCRSLAHRLDLPHLDLDIVCRTFLEKDQVGWQLLKGTLTSSFFLADGRLDRQKLRQAIFSDDDLRRTVDDLLHPLALERMWEAVDQAGGKADTILVEVPLLFEAQWQVYFDRIVVVYADAPTCCRRIMARDRVTASEAARGLAVQLSPTAKALLGDHVLDNSGSWFGTLLIIKHLAGVLASTS